MRNARNILCILLLLHALSVGGQTKTELRDMFFSAEGDVLYEDYSEALPKYLNLVKIFPENYNIHYRVGQCYLNTPGEKEKSVPFLEAAAQHVNPGYHEGRFREKGAPFDAIYYLANAYRINNDLDKALEYYRVFIKEADPDIYDTALVNFQIKSCYTARRLMNDPVYVVEHNLGPVINDRFSESDPVVSADEKMLVFTRKLQFYDAVFYSTRSGSNWSTPVNMTPQLGIDQDFFSSSVSGDGTTLLLYKTDNYEGNIYLSHFSDGRWSPVERLNDNINTKYWESHATVSDDGKKIYFTSNRKGGYGGLDIYVAEKDSTGDWGTPVNMGPVINSVYHEESPFLANKGRTLFFSSRGHDNMGGYDIFRSDLNEKGEWSTPVNIGYPVNTTDDDLFYCPVGDGYKGYYARFIPSGNGRMDIVTYTIYDESHPRSFYVTGKASIKNLLDEFEETIKISAVDNAGSGKTVNTFTDPRSGDYSLRLPQGSFTFTFTADGINPLSKVFTLPLTHPGDTIVVETVDMDNNDYSADLQILSDTLCRITTDDPLQFNLITEKSSLLNISLLSDDTLLLSEKHVLSDTLFSYSLLPPEGGSKLLFVLTDRFGNKTSAAVLIDKSITAHVSKPQYERIIAEKQVASLLEMMKKYAGREVTDILESIDPAKEKSGSCDDLVAAVKNRALDSGIDPVVIDKLALEVALKEGVMTQAASELLYEQSNGEIHKTIDGTDIYALKLKNWNDYTAFIEAESDAKIKRADIENLARYILLDPEPGIDIIRMKILYAASFVPDSTLIAETVMATDAMNIRYRGEWLDRFTETAVNKGLEAYVDRILAAISCKPGSGTDDYLRHISSSARGELSDYLKSVNLSKSRTRSPEELIKLMRNSSLTGDVDHTELANTLSDAILKADLSNEDIGINMTGHTSHLWWILIIILILLTLTFIIWQNRIKKNKE